MFLKKVRNRESGILLYGISPPKAQSTPEKLQEIADKGLIILRTLDIDALVVYDLQDEAERTAEERPFPFVSCLDPHVYASRYLRELAIPKIIYRPAGKFTNEELTLWLNDLSKQTLYPVFVGLPSPDSVPKTTLTEAYRIWRENHQHDSVIGAVTIPERHAILKDEDARMLDKMNCGVSYFISQCIFNVDYTRKVLDDLVAACKREKRHTPTVIFTLTLCGSAKTLLFLEWLGIHIPDNVKEALRTSVEPLTLSRQIATRIANDLAEYCVTNDIPFGFNVESVSARKEEVDASLMLLNTVREILNVARTKAAQKAKKSLLAR
ncbi:MAG TPA: hypothetical protein VK508_14665 [Cyclobacteriaceae bacterium]|nr:hypothetical protein [Cyclobacteriaceae bacterium]